MLVSWAGVARADGGALVTVIGEISQPNRGPLDPFMDAFLKFNDKQFDRAFVLDRSALLALPQRSIRANAEGWPAAVAAEGPLVRDVLAASGASSKASVSFVALDGYAASLSAEELAAEDWVLAISVDGKPIGIGGRGPAWLMHDTGEAAISAEAEAKWVWSVYLIVVGEK
ncbi:MAG: hypothetical protein GC150_11010 [Rhizobiales bacterium]|nr:hypothetical protein [Hyphomicrobiales bacterium]